MATPDYLAAKLQHMDIATDHKPATTPQQHVLNFRFPVNELLPQGVEPLNDEPKHIRKREVPTNESCQKGIVGTNFFTVFKKGEDIHPLENASSSTDTKQNLMNAVESLKHTAGESCLQIATYHSKDEKDQPYFASNGEEIDNRLRVRFRLITKTCADEPTHQDFEINQRQWNNLIRYAQETPWIATVEDLVLQASERAVHEVHKTRLEQCDPGRLSKLELEWMWWWYRDPLQTPEEILLKSLYLSDEGKEALEKPGDAMLCPWYQCGHSTEIRKIELLSLPEDGIFQLQCSRCDQPVIGPHGLAEYQRKLDNDDLLEYRKRTDAWLELDRLPVLETVQVFNSLALCNALDVVLDSFRMPRAVCLRQLCGPNFEETAAIQGAFYDSIGDRTAPTEWKATAADLIGELESLASETVSALELANLTPGLGEFVSAWIRRAVKLLTHQKCSSNNNSHVGVHFHKKKSAFYFNERMEPDSDGYGEDQESEEDVEDMIDELEQKMEETTMEQNWYDD